MRHIASGMISFGLVSIPIHVFPVAESSASVRFNLLHKACGTRVKQQYVCPKDEVIVPREDMVKGYEFDKNRFVTFNDEELKALEPEGTGAIEISEFLPATEVDPVYFDRAYYLGPQKGGGRAYKLLNAAMRETGRVALAKYAARGKMYLVMIRPLDETLVMQQLHYAEEVRSTEEVPKGEGEVKTAELALAKQLIDQIASEEFEPAKYHDEVRDQVKALIQQKIEGEEITAAPAEAPRAQVIDIMEALRASLAAKGVQEAATGEKKRATGAHGAARARKKAAGEG